jgi:hypothetical protein
MHRASLFCSCARSALGLTAVVADQLIEGDDSIDAADFRRGVGPQEIANAPAGANGAQGNAAGGKFLVKFVQRVRAGEIDIGRR